MVVGPDFSKKRGVFFAQVFGHHTGYLGLAKKKPDGSGWRERFFRYPDQLDEALFWVDEAVPNHDLYFCAQLLTTTKRAKEAVGDVALLWADLDPCPPERLQVYPTFVIETSPGHWQAIWRLDEAIDAIDAETISRRIAYYHKGDGVDQSGWDLTQLLRIPFTWNFKYGETEHPTVRIVDARRGHYRVDDFKVYEPIAGEVATNGSVPTVAATGAQILEQYKERLRPIVFRLFETEPDQTQKEGWSGALWKLILECAEAGLPIEETLAVARDSACNKYERDGRPLQALWREVQKAYAKTRAQAEAIVASVPKPSEILSSDYRRPESFVSRYIEWATEQTDAAEIYHQAGAFLVLSAALSGMIVLPTSDRPEGEPLNLWFFILANSTITRKTTAMNMAKRMAIEVQPDVVAATEATIEGMLTMMAARPGKPTVFMRDEFAGMLESVQKKDYYAGMFEQLTQLYDGYDLERQLAKEKITVKDPRLIMFVGGAKDTIFELLSERYIRSGFLPRFLFFVAESSIENYRPLGPPTPRSEERRDDLIDELNEIVRKYQNILLMRMPVGKSSIPRRPHQRLWKARLTEEAWLRNKDLELTMVKDGQNSSDPFVAGPIYLRLHKSILKAACLLAACRPENPVGDHVLVTPEDIEHAASFGIGWRKSALEVMIGAGASHHESEMRRVMEFLYIREHNGTLRSAVMRKFRLRAREADDLFNTLEARAMIRKVPMGNNDWLVFPAGV